MVVARPPRPFPRRVWVVGPSGAGKSTLAARLAAALGAEAIHLDDLHWGPGWTERPTEELAAAVAQALSRPTWVVDGNYAKIQARFLARAELVVWLDLPLAVTLRRVAARTWSRVRRATPCCNGNHESWTAVLLRRDSILRWALTSHRPTRRRYARALSALPHVRLRHPRAVERYLRAVVSARRG